MDDKRENLMTCAACGEQASGPDAKSVAEAMTRHDRKRHPKKAVTK